jgi:hypothetical protein
VGLVSLLTNLSQFRYYTGKGYTGDGDVPGLDVGSITYSSINPTGVPLTDLLSNSSRFTYYSSQGYTSGGGNPGMKSLKYGNDQLGGGNSGQPYIQVPIPDGFNDLQLSNNDFILRGGALVAKNSATDVLRLGKMFANTKSPNGLSFVAKQNLLSRTAVRTQTSGTPNGGVYTPLSTLAEAGLVAFGTHLNKQGLNPFAGTGAYSNNSNLYGVKIKNNQPSAENRLVNLYQAQQVDFESKPFGNGVTLNKGNINVLSYTGGPGSILGVGNTNITYADGQQTGLANSKNSTGRYYGPLTWTPPISNAAYSGDVNTINQINNSIFSGNFISLQSYSNDIINNVYLSSTSYTTPTQYAANSVDRTANPLLVTQTPQPGAAPKQQFVQNAFAYTQGMINAEQKDAIGSPALQDFRQIIRAKNLSNLSSTQIATSKAIGATPDAPDYGGKQAYESRFNIGGNNGSGPGYKGIKNLVSYKNGSGIGPIDKINAEGVYQSSSVDTTKPVNDLVKFRIAIIDNSDPTNKTFIHFRAFIDNFSDSYNANWNPVTYLGRGENFYTYSNYTRTVSMGWTVAAQSKEELIPMYKKLNYLASSLTPYYTSKGYMAGNLVQLTVGGYLYETVGIINSITYDIPEESPWEIGIDDDDGSDSTVKELSHIIRVTNFSFTPIQDFIPSVQPVGDQDGLSRYISLSSGDSNNYINNGNPTPPEKSGTPTPENNPVPLPSPLPIPESNNANTTNSNRTNPKPKAKLNPNPNKPTPKKNTPAKTNTQPTNPFIQTNRAIKDNTGNRSFGAFAPKAFKW